MATGGLEELECVICNESLVDPRALPCGHSYCGPPRPCLTGLKGLTGGLCCAICRVDHDLEPEDIKPLYGIRDYLLKKASTPDIPCSAHKSKKCSFWCNDCETMICVDCTEDEHDGHFVRNLKKHLISKIESLFGKLWRDGLVDYRENLEKMRFSKKYELEKLKLRLEEIQKQLEAVQLQTSVVDGYTETLSQGNDEKRGSETLSLLNLSNLGLLEMDRVESSTQCNTVCCEISTQYESFTRSVSSQSYSVTAYAKVSTASQTEAPLSHCSTSMTELEVSNAKCSSDHKTDNNQRLLCGLRLERKESSDSSFRSFADDELLDCCCTLKHKEVSNWSFPIRLSVFLRVSKRSCSFVIGASNTLYVCPFVFHVRAKGVQRKSKPNEKLVKFIVSCRKSNEDHDKLPVSTFRYVFILENYVNGKDKKYEGTWHYPKEQELHWHSITYSELINHASGWVDDDNDLKVEIELMKVA